MRTVIQLIVFISLYGLAQAQINEASSDAVEVAGTSAEADATGLTNGSLLPVVFSVNCASGIFDDETTADYAPNTYFAEHLVRMDGGAVGVLGDTRNSPSWPNTALAMGF